jgi:hypothetical protein
VDDDEPARWTVATTNEVVIRVEDYDGRLEWSVLVAGVLWAAGDCEGVADGESRARACLAARGVR